MTAIEGLSRFFVSGALGMEAEVLLEIQEVWGELLDLDGRPHSFALTEIQAEKGGVSLTAPLHLGLQLNFFLKLPHRILLRLKEFRCRDFPKLFAEAKKIQLKDYSDHPNWQLEVAASKSRLNHEGRIQETLESAWGLGVKNKAEAVGSIFVRFFDDTCSISLDTTGEHLHFRGGDLHKGEAPLRETLAAYCLRQMIGGRSAQEIAKITWIDPMMGSGTFLMELTELYQVNAGRDFSFQKWKKTPKALKTKDWLRNYHSNDISKEKDQFKDQIRSEWQIIGADINVKSVELAQQNFIKRNLVGAHFLQEDLFQKRTEQELLSLQGKDSGESNSPRWVITNPPYGERLAASFSPEQLLAAVDKRWAPEKVGVLFSKRQASEAPTQVGGLRRVQSFPVSNGGLLCEFLIWQRS